MHGAPAVRTTVLDCVYAVPCSTVRLYVVPTELAVASSETVITVLVSVLVNVSSLALPPPLNAHFPRPRVTLITQTHTVQEECRKGVLLQQNEPSRGQDGRSIRRRPAGADRSVAMRERRCFALGRLLRISYHCDAFHSMPLLLRSGTEHVLCRVPPQPMPRRVCGPWQAARTSGAFDDGGQHRARGAMWNNTILLVWGWGVHALATHASGG